MFFTVANHNEAKNAKGFINYDNVEFTDIPKMVTSGYAYSAGKFKDGHRKNDNWEGCVDVLILDVDAGCTIKQAMEIFKKYEHYIITTRSHQKEKNGIVCDRFRVLIHLDKTINEPSVMDNLMNKIINMYPFLDSSCIDRGRYFFSSQSDAEIIYNQGIRFNAIYPVIVTETPLKPPKAQNAINIPSDNIYCFCELRNVWVDKHGNELESGYSEDGVNYEAKLKGAIKVLDNEFYSGNRNHCIFKVMAMLRNDGLDGNDIVNFTIQENDKRGGIPLRELMAVWKSVERL